MLSNVTPCSLHRLISQHQIVSLSIVTGGRISQQQVVCPTATGDSVSLTGHGLRLVLNIHALLAVIALSADLVYTPRNTSGHCPSGYCR